MNREKEFMRNSKEGCIKYFHQNNRTALMQAAENGNAHSVRLLLGAGADIDAKDYVSH